MCRDPAENIKCVKTENFHRFSLSSRRLGQCRCFWLLSCAGDGSCWLSRSFTCWRDVAFGELIFNCAHPGRCLDNGQSSCVNELSQLEQIMMMMKKLIFHFHADYTLGNSTFIRNTLFASLNSICLFPHRENPFQCWSSYTAICRTFPAIMCSSSYHWAILDTICSRWSR